MHSYRVLLVNSVDTIVFAIVYFALEALTCVRSCVVLAVTLD